MPVWASDRAGWSSTNLSFSWDKWQSHLIRKRQDTYNCMATNPPEKVNCFPSLGDFLPETNGEEMRYYRINGKNANILYIYILYIYRYIELYIYIKHPGMLPSIQWPIQCTNLFPKWHSKDTPGDSTGFQPATLGSNVAGLKDEASGVYSRLQSPNIPSGNLT